MPSLPMKPMQRASSTVRLLENARSLASEGFMPEFYRARTCTLAAGLSTLGAARGHALAERGALSRVEGLAGEGQHRRPLAVHGAPVQPREARHVLGGGARLALDDREQALPQAPPLGVHGLVLAL